MSNFLAADFIYRNLRIFSEVFLWNFVYLNLKNRFNYEIQNLELKITFKIFIFIKNNLDLKNA